MYSRSFCATVGSDDDDDGRSEDAELKLALLKKLLYDLGIEYVDNRSVNVCRTHKPPFYCLYTVERNVHISHSHVSSPELN